MWYAVRKTRGTEAAWTKSILSGLGRTFLAGTATSSAYPPSISLPMIE
jgi:hypothetical protein